MSLDQAAAPTDAGSPAAFDAPRQPARIEYFRAYQQTVQGPNWVVTLLWGMLAFFSSGVIPIIGPMVWTGYLYECVEVLTLSRGRVFPDFDANRFGAYMSRGVFPFLVQLVSWLGLAALYVLLYIFMVLIAVVASAIGEQHLPIIVALGGMLYALVVAAVVVLPMILLCPLMLRLGLSQNLALGFNLPWCGDFLRRMWLEIVLSTLFVLMTGTVLTLLGCVFLFIGSYVAWAWVTMANAHLSWQIYEIYLARGGQRVPLKPKQVAPPPFRYPEGGPPGYPLPAPANMTRANGATDAARE